MLPEPSFGTRSLWLAIILFIAGVFYAVEKKRQPAVLGELLGGILLGNLGLAGITGLEAMKDDEVIRFLAKLGVCLLLFQIGLESNVREMRRVGIRAFTVATCGVVASCVLAGFLAGPWILPASSHTVAAYFFTGAMLAATSASISVRVLRDLGRLQTHEAKTILGAAVIDDVMGLSLLAVAAAMVQARTTGGPLHAATLGRIVLEAILFLFGAIAAGRMAAPRIAAWLARISVEHKMKLIFAFVFFLVYMYGAELVGLDAVIGAFAGGLVLEAVHFRGFRDPLLVEQLRNTILPPPLQRQVQQAAERHVNDLIAGPAYVLVPVFFVVTGSLVDLRTLANPRVLEISGVLLVAAVLGKLACALGAGKAVNRWIVAGAMIARGEVQLLGASMGIAAGVISKEIFTAVVIVVVATTVLVPLLLSRLLRHFTTHPFADL